MNWIEQDLTPHILADQPRKKGVPEGLWNSCPACAVPLFAEELAKALQVCPSCGYHVRMSSRSRLESLLDPEGIVELADSVRATDALGFTDGKSYSERLSQAAKRSESSEALVVAEGRLCEIPVVLAIFEFGFMGGSMGAVVGERFVRGVSRALELACPFICFTASGGARMQEGLFSLMQMAKTNAALTRLSERGIPYISVLTYPTMGGVSASFSFMGDLVLAEPGALVGFAGPRVIQQTVREQLPPGFQTAEFLIGKGAIDDIIDRRSMRAYLASVLSILASRPSPVSGEGSATEG